MAGDYCLKACFEFAYLDVFMASADDVKDNRHSDIDDVILTNSNVGNSRMGLKSNMGLRVFFRN